jgi:hypothetical protein
MEQRRTADGPRGFADLTQRCIIAIVRRGDPAACGITSVQSLLLRTDVVGFTRAAAVMMAPARSGFL